jgi:hypothetical protein
MSARHSNLLAAFKLGEFDRDEILDRLNNLKRLRSEGDAEPAQPIGIRDNLTQLENAQLKLNEVTGKIIENLQNCTPELKRLAFNAPDIKVCACTGTVEIQGVITLELPTTARTLA